MNISSSTIKNNNKKLAETSVREYFTICHAVRKKNCKPDEFLSNWAQINAV